MGNRKNAKPDNLENINQKMMDCAKLIYRNLHLFKRVSGKTMHKSGEILDSARSELLRLINGTT